MSTTLAELQAKMRERQAKQGNDNQQTVDRSSYPFWNIPEGTDAVVRFLPDGNDSNDYFWVEQSHILLPFSGVLGRDDREVKISVPCMQMYGEKCPIIEETKGLWKTDEALARKYYRKKTMIFHGFVRKDPIEYDDAYEAPENPIRKFKVTAQLFKKIEAGLMDSEMEYIPCDLVNGTDFRILRTKNGQFSDYNASNWSRRSTPLTEAEALAVEKFGIPDMSSYIPKRPDDQTLKVIMDMFVDSFNGLPYDLEKFGNYFKPYGFDDQTPAKPQSVQTTLKQKMSTAKPTVDENDEPPFDVDPPVRSTSQQSDAPKKVDVQALLAQIQKNKK